MPMAYYHNCTDVKGNTLPTLHCSNQIRASFTVFSLCTAAFLFASEWEVRSWSLWRLLTENYHTTQQLYINSESNPEQRERTGRGVTACVFHTWIIKEVLKRKTVLLKKKTLSTSYASSTYSVLHCTYVLMLFTFF